MRMEGFKMNPDHADKVNEVVNPPVSQPGRRGGGEGE
jgi:hypothetical protein